MESKIKNYLENVDGFIDYTRKRTRTASEVDGHVAETNRLNSTVSESSNATQHILNDTVHKLMMFNEYCMELELELVSSPRRISPNHSSDIKMTEFDKPGAFTPQSKVDDWSEAELVALWIAVRKYGDGNWKEVLEDPSMPFLKDKTPEELGAMWTKEASKIFPKAPPLPSSTVFSNGTTTTPSPIPRAIASDVSGFSFMKLLAEVENQSLKKKKKKSDMNKRSNQSKMMHMERQEMLATIATNDEVVVKPKLLPCGQFELPIVTQKKSEGSSMENPIEIDD